MRVFAMHWMAYCSTWQDLSDDRFEKRHHTYVIAEKRSKAYEERRMRDLIEQRQRLARRQQLEDELASQHTWSVQATADKKTFWPQRKWSLRDIVGNSHVWM